jgi:hypothetical protein
MSHSLDGELLEFHEYCVNLQRRTDECVFKAEQSDKSSDHHSLQWDDIVSGLSHSTLQPLSFHSPQTIINPEVTVPTHHPAAAQALTEPPSDTQFQQVPPSSADDDTNSKDSKERRERQSFWEQKFGTNSMFQRPYGPFERDEAEKGDQASSPPSRGASRNGKAQKSFLSGLRKKGGKGDEKDKGIPMKDTEGRPGSGWNVGMA